jgi:CheY-like chemotaxis protein
MLSEPGVMQVTATAVSESQAVAQIDAQAFDALVVDIELKPGSGIDVVLHARKHWAHRATPLIIVLSNYNFPLAKERSLRAGADHFLDKMKHFDQVYPLIRTHCG